MKLKAKAKGDVYLIISNKDGVVWRGSSRLRLAPITVNKGIVEIDDEFQKANKGNSYTVIDLLNRKKLESGKFE